jgi:hypothetical protein
MEFLATHSKLANMFVEIGDFAGMQLIDLKPDFISDKKYLRYIALLQELYATHAAVPDRNTLEYKKLHREFYSCMRSCSIQDIDYMMRLVEFLMLPNSLVQKLQVVKYCKMLHKMAVYSVEILNTLHIINTFDISSIKDWSAVTAKLMENAAEYGQIEFLRHAHEHGCKFHVYNCETAARVGSLDCLTYAHQHGCKLSYRQHDYTREIGYYPNEKEYRNDGYRTYIRITSGVSAARAATSDHFECFEYAFINDDTYAPLEYYIPFGLKYVQYANEHAIYDKTDVKICLRAVQRGQFDCLRYLHKQGFAWNEIIGRQLGCSGNSTDACVRYAYKNGCPMDEDIIVKLKPVVRVKRSVVENWQVQSR